MNLSVWTKAIRPKTLAVAISPVCMGTCMAFQKGFFHFWIFFCTLFSALGIQIISNLVNDYCDFMKGSDTASRKGPVRVMQAGLVSTKAMKIAILTTCILTVVSGCFLIIEGGIFFAGLLAISILFAILYTAGPLPISYLGIGELFVFIFFGPVATAGTYFLQTHTITLNAILAGIPTGLIPSGLLIMNNLRDIEEDRIARKKTLAVRFGPTFSKWEYAFCLLVSTAIPWYLLSDRPFIALTTLSIFPAVALVIELFKAKEAVQYHSIFIKTTQLILLYTALFCFGWML